MIEIFAGFKTEQGESKSILSGCFAVTATIIAARFSEDRNNLVWEIYDWIVGTMLHFDFQLGR